jgi:hypothetical protein
MCSPTKQNKKCAALISNSFISDERVRECMEAGTHFDIDPEPGSAQTQTTLFLKEKRDVEDPPRKHPVRLEASI